MGLSTCKGCGNKFNTKDKQTYSGKAYCPTCYEGQVNAGKDYRDLIDTICLYFEMDKPTSLIYKHMKDYQEQLGYPYSAMTYTLWYCKFIKGYKFDSKYGMACVKYECDNAKAYYMQQLKIQESVTIASKTDEKINEVTINIKKQDRKSILIDIDELINKGCDN